MPGLTGNPSCLSQTRERQRMRGPSAHGRRAIVAKTLAVAAVFLARVEIRSPAVQTPAIKHCKPANRGRRY